MKTGTEIEFKRAYNWAGDMNGYIPTGRDRCA